MNHPARLRHHGLMALVLILVGFTVAPTRVCAQACPPVVSQPPTMRFETTPDGWVVLYSTVWRISTYQVEPGRWGYFDLSPVMNGGCYTSEYYFYWGPTPLRWSTGTTELWAKDLVPAVKLGEGTGDNRPVIDDATAVRSTFGGQDGVSVKIFEAYTQPPDGPSSEESLEPVETLQLACFDDGLAPHISSKYADEQRR